MSITESIGVNMKARRSELGLTLQQIADRAGTSKSHVWELEQGRSANPTITMTVAIADALSMSINRLIGRDISQPMLSEDELELIQQHRRIFGRAALKETTNEG
jgi:transcriptional regulator with XRE-family HTH domain